MSIVFLAARPALFRRSIRRMRVRAFLLGAAAMTSYGLAPSVLEAQLRASGRNEVFAGSDLESYLRYLQTEGKSESYPWTIRSFSLSEIDTLAAKDSAHPWARRYGLQRRQRASGLEWDYVRPQVTFYLNSSFPYGGNDGAVWQGKGLTTSFQGGLSARWGPLSAVVAPVVFRAENQSFTLMRNGQIGNLRFAHGQFPFEVDKPQRFGKDPYSRIDPGQSTIRFDDFGVAVGLSTANQWWGPADHYPFILGNNAPGFLHFFFGTSRPANIWIAKLHTRVVYGQLDQSDYSSVTGPDYFRSFAEPGTRRFMAGLIFSLQPRGAPGLEIGAARFFHTVHDSSWTASHLLGLPFQDLFKVGLKQESDTAILGGTQGLKENQLASVFLRWAPPGSGFEVYGEYGREDHALDRRDLVVELDHATTVNVGFRKAWLAAGLMRAVRAEAFTYETPAGTRRRAQGQTYLNGVIRQGHTQRGQILGANVGPGRGSAQIIAFDRFAVSGRLSVFASREVQHENRIDNETRNPTPRARDVLNSLGVEGTRFIGPFDVMGRAVLTVDINRYMRADRANGNFALGVRQNF